MNPVTDLVSLRKNGTVEVVADGVAHFHGFCNVGLVWGGGAALAVDTSNQLLGPRASAALGELTGDPLAYIVYTHGHVDHVGGAAAFVAAAAARGSGAPVIWAHELVLERFRRYGATWSWNNEVNRRQFQLPAGIDAFPRRFIAPDQTYRDVAHLRLGSEPVELHHAKGETDDATWVWLPQRATALVGDLSVQSLPNTGNPNKPQRYTREWAETLEAIAQRRPRYVIPGHGDPLSGDQALEVLRETARALRFLHDAVLERLNAGAWPDEIVDAGIALPRELAAKSYLQPIYGCTDFVVRDVLRAYAGWWGGDPADLMPAGRAAVARDVVDIAGRDRLVERVRTLVNGGELRRALHLAMFLARADPAPTDAHDLVAHICGVLAEREPSFIVRNFYRTAAAQARAARR